MATGYAWLVKAILEVLEMVGKPTTFEGIRRHLSWHHRINIGRNGLKAELHVLEKAGKVTHTVKNWCHYYNLTKGAKMASKCPTCKRARCVWIDLKRITERVPTEELERVVAHNLSYIEMIYAGHQGSAASEERMINALNPYCDEIEKRKSNPATAVAKNKEPKMAKEKLSLGSVLRAKRESMAMDRAVLAKKIGITPGYYGLIETSAPAHVSEKLLGKIVKVLGVKSDLTALREEHNQINRDYEKSRRDAKAKEAKGLKKATSNINKKIKAGKVAMPPAKKVIRRKAKPATSAKLAVTEPAAQQPVG